MINKTSVSVSASLFTTLILTQCDMEPAHIADPVLAQIGQQNLFYGTYISRGLTEDFYSNLWTIWEPELRDIAANLTPEQRREMAFDRYGWVEATYPNDNMPFGYRIDEEGNVYLNCLQCHGGEINGVSYVGVGNNKLDLQTISEDSAILLAAMQGIELTRPVTSFLPFNHSVGVPAGFNYSALLLQNRDLDLNLIEEPVDIGEFDAGDTDVPPWWGVKYKERLYYDGFADSSPRSVMQLLMVLNNPVEIITEAESDFENIYEYINSIEAPAYPGPIDFELALEGKKYFNETCSGCHGRYDNFSAFPSVSVPVAVVGTDGKRLAGFTREFRQYYADSWFGYYGESDIWLEPEGYIAPPLVGIWASAPYFHNGSVPTLHDVLFSEERPDVWELDKSDEENYDFAKLGVRYISHDSVPEREYLYLQRRIFDSFQPGKSNGGHTFAGALTYGQKIAIMEYLKTL